MLVDFSPLKKYPQFRRLYIAQLISQLGTNLTHIGIPYFLFQKTHSTAQVGLIGIIELIPLILAGFWGGLLADTYDRKKLIIICEIALAALCIILAGYAYSGSDDIWPIYLIGASMAFFSGLHRPSLEALTPRLIPKEELPKIGTLNGLRGTFAHVIGPAISGILIAKFGVLITFTFDAISYLFSIALVSRIKGPTKVEKIEKMQLSRIVEGFQYATSRPVLLGSYSVDIIAMSLCFPAAIFPALAEMFGGASKVGTFYSAAPFGAFIMSILSAWTYRYKRYGKAIALAAIGWSLSLAAISFASNYWLILLLISLAGASDMISAIFRVTLWNEIIPDSHRGRLASIEMISYMSGPLIGTTLIGLFASLTSPKNALLIGGLLSTTFIIIISFALKPFWKFEGSRKIQPV